MLCARVCRDVGVGHVVCSPPLPLCVAQAHSIAAVEPHAHMVWEGGVGEWMLLHNCGSMWWGPAGHRGSTTWCPPSCFSPQQRPAPTVLPRGNTCCAGSSHRCSYMAVTGKRCQMLVLLLGGPWGTYPQSSSTGAVAG
jgi:hypothetical protein